MTLRPVVCFSHGQESGPWGTKITRLAQVAGDRGWPVESLDYRGIADPLQRVEELAVWCRGQARPPILVGSSMGGFVALVTAIRMGVTGLFLLAPALYVPGYEHLLPATPPTCPLTVVHGWSDAVIPWQHSARYGAQSGGRVILLAGDHRLTSGLDEISRLFGVFLDELWPAPSVGEPVSGQRQVFPTA